MSPATADQKPTVANQGRRSKGPTLSRVVVQTYRSASALLLLAVRRLTPIMNRPAPNQSQNANVNRCILIPNTFSHELSPSTKGTATNGSTTRKVAVAAAAVAPRHNTPKVNASMIGMARMHQAFCE